MQWHIARDIQELMADLEGRLAAAAGMFDLLVDQSNLSLTCVLMLFWIPYDSLDVFAQSQRSTR